MEDVFTNIIVNAYQAMGEGRGSLSVELREEEGNILISFSDEGPGIKTPHRKHLRSLSYDEKRWNGVWPLPGPEGDQGPSWIHLCGEQAGPGRNVYD